MTGLITSLTTVLAAGALALGGAADPGSGAGSGGASDGPRTALVIDASHARDGRELLDSRLRDLDADVRLPRSSEEARTNVRYFDALGYRVVVSGPHATAAAAAAGVEALDAPDLASAVRAR